MQDRKERRERRDSGLLAEIDGTGRVVDFHALRATYITLLVKSGASVKVVQELARHSDPKLTLNIYTKLGVHDLSGGLRGLPGLEPRVAPADGSQVFLPTGSTGEKQTIISEPHLFPHQLGRDTAQAGAGERHDRRSATAAHGPQNPLEHKAKCDTARSAAKERKNAPGRIRTCDRRIRNPLLYPAELRARYAGNCRSGDGGREACPAVTAQRELAGEPRDARPATVLIA
jgi:hypothetical protein